MVSLCLVEVYIQVCDFGYNCLITWYVFTYVSTALSCILEEEEVNISLSQRSI